MLNRQFTNCSVNIAFPGDMFLFLILMWVWNTCLSSGYFVGTSTAVKKSHFLPIYQKLVHLKEGHCENGVSFPQTKIECVCVCVFFLFPSILLFLSPPYFLFLSEELICAEDLGAYSLFVWIPICSYILKCLHPSSKQKLHFTAKVVFIDIFRILKILIMMKGT